MFRIRRIRREKRIRRIRHIRLMRQMHPYLPHLPDEILLLLFSHIPLSDLILSVGRVCRDWARNQRAELARRQTVFIFQKNKQLNVYQQQQNPYGCELITRVRRDDGETAWHQLQPLKQIRFNAIRMPNAELSEEFTSFLMDLLPNVTHLSVAFKQNLIVRAFDGQDLDSALMTYKQIVRLTNHYRLESFAFDFEFNANEVYEFIDRIDDDDSDEQHELQDEFTNTSIALFESINRIGTLRHLMLNGTILTYMPELKGTRPNLSRLESFVIHDFGDFRVIYEWLMTAEPGNVRVGCSSRLWTGNGLAFSRQLAGNFVRYNCLERLTSHDYNHERFHEFFGRFSSLTTLKVSLECRSPDISMAMTMLARYLTQLSQLIHLEVDAGFIPQEERTPQLPLAQVPSVRLLSLIIDQSSHSHTQRLHLHKIFPNLQVLGLYYRAFKCEECGYDCFGSFSSLAEFRATKDQTVGTAPGTDNADDNDSNSSKLSVRALYENCARQALQPFRYCASVHTVNLNLSIGNRTVERYDLNFLTKRAQQWRIIPVDDQL